MDPNSSTTDPSLGSNPTGFRPRNLARVGRSLTVWLTFLIVLGIGGYLAFGRSVGRRAGVPDAASLRSAQVIPVTVAAARRGDLDRYLSAIGSVVAFNTVTVKPRVNGQIVNVAFKEGQLLQAGDLLVEIDPRPYQAALLQAEGQLKKDLAALKDANVTLERNRMLFANDVIAKQTLDDQTAVVGQDRGAIVMDRANIDTAKLNLAYAKIVAPITGRIGLRLVDVGNFVQTSDTTGLAVITQLQPIAVDFSIPEDDLQPVIKATRVGQELPVDVYNRDLKTKLATGSLETFDSQIDQTTGTIKLKAIFPNTDYTLFPNQFVNVKMLVDKTVDAVLIPTAALQRNPQGTFVYVVDRDKQVQVRTVRVSQMQGDTVALTAGVNPGEMVVTDGVDRLQPGSKVIFQLAASGASQDRPQ